MREERRDFGVRERTESLKRERQETGPTTRRSVGVATEGGSRGNLETRGQGRVTPERTGTRVLIVGGGGDVVVGQEIESDYERRVSRLVVDC